MTRSWRRRLVGVILCAVFGFFALTSFATGVTLDGIDAPAAQCLRNAPRAAEGGPFYENSRVTGKRTFLPLGINCTYESRTDSYGPQTMVNSNWPATIAWITCTVIALFGAILLVNPKIGSGQKLRADAAHGVDL